MIELIGYSYPLATLEEVVEAEARQGRKVAVVIKHAGGWAVSEGWGCTCLEYQGDDEDCPIHGKLPTPEVE